MSSRKRIGAVDGKFEHNLLDSYIEQQMEHARQALNGMFIKETIAKLSEIADDITHPAHFEVMALLRKVVTEQEKNDETDSSR